MKKSFLRSKKILMFSFIVALIVTTAVFTASANDSFGGTKYESIESRAATTEIDYDSIPDNVKANNAFAVFVNGGYRSAYDSWKTATQAAANIFKVNKTEEVTILLLKDYTNYKEDAFVALAANYANGRLIIDLGGHTFTRVDTFLNLHSSNDISNVATSNIVVRNGTVKSDAGDAIIVSQITNKNYPAEKKWNVTFDGVTIGYGNNPTTARGLYQAWTSDATADDAQLGTKTNLVFNNCTFDFKSSCPSKAFTFLNLKDNNDGVDKIDVSVKINGGEILANKDRLKYLTFYKLNEGSDSITLAPGEDGNYTVLKTDSTPLDFSHYAEVFPMAEGDGCFFEVSDDGTNSVYELKPLNMTYELLSGATQTGTLDLGAKNKNAKYLSIVDYPFVIFNQTGRFYDARATLLDGALSTAIYNVSNVSSKPSGNTAYVLMRRDYTMTTEGQDNLSHGRESGIVIDMQGYSIIEDGSVKLGDSDAIFVSIIKRWNGSADGIYTFATRYYVRNGTFKTHTARVLYSKTHNSATEKDENGNDIKIDVDISQKLMAWTFDNVSFELLPGAKVDRFFHVANASSKTSPYSAPVELTLNDCTFDLTKNTSSASSFNVIRCNFGANTSNSYAKINGTVEINGGKIMANTLDKTLLIYYVEGNEFNLTYGTGSDGRYITLVLDKGADHTAVSNDEKAAFTEKVERDDAEHDYYTINTSDIPRGYFVKTNITLQTSFIYNVYIPKNAKITDFAVICDGITEKESTTVTIDGVEYYQVALKIPASKTLENVNVQVKFGEEGKPTVSLTWTLGILKYANTILDGKYTEISKDLVKDVLLYACTAHNYFENTYNVSDKIAKIEEIISSNYRHLPKGTAKTLSGNYFTKVAISLSDTPAFRFYLASGYTANDFTFSVAGCDASSIKKTTSTDNGSPFVEISVPAYAMLSDVTVTYKNGNKVSGAYNIFSYHDYAVKHREEFSDSYYQLVLLVEGLMKYSETAKKYQDYIYNREYGSIKIYAPDTIYPDCPGLNINALFTNGSYYGLVTWTTDNPNVYVEDGKIYAVGNFATETEVTVTATTEHHKITKTVKVAATDSQTYKYMPYAYSGYHDGDVTTKGITLTKDDGSYITGDFVITGKLNVYSSNITETGHPHVQFRFAHENRFMLQDNDHNNLFTVGKGEEKWDISKGTIYLDWAVIVKDMTAYLYFDGVLEGTLNLTKAEYFNLGTLRMDVFFYDIEVCLKESNATEYAELLTKYGVK